MAESSRPRIALFGGTFDPIHIGHLRSILELKETLELDEVHLVPCHQPPHRATPGVSSAQRMAMAELAVAGEVGLSVDGRELNRDGHSYTIETLREVRAEEGEEASLIWVMGSDAFQHLPSWHCWEELTELAHLVVMARPDYAWPSEGLLAEWFQQHRLASAAALSERPCGGVLPIELMPLPISATDIRHMIETGRSPRYLLPDAVWNYIRNNQLYGYAAEP